MLVHQRQQSYFYHVHNPPHFTSNDQHPVWGRGGGHKDPMLSFRREPSHSFFIYLFRLCPET